MNNNYDIAIIGGGPAGLTAAIYVLRAGKTCVVFERDVPGGNINETYCVENIPGFTSIEGSVFAEQLTEQAESCGAEIVYEEVLTITYSELDNAFFIDTDENLYKVKSAIVATGTKHNVLGLEHEDEFIGNGIHFCALCDGQFYKNKDVVVVGGGNSALTEALYLSNICKSVTILLNLANLTGDQILIEKAYNTNNIKVITNCNKLDYLIRDNTLLGMLYCTDTTLVNQLDQILCAGIFLAIGLSPNSDCTNGLLVKDEKGYITNSLVDGLYFAGDCSAYNDVKLVVTACGSGATMAVAACKYIDSLER